MKTIKKIKKPLLLVGDSFRKATQMDVCVGKDNCYWPQIVDYKQIINENPDAIFILNKRNPEANAPGGDASAFETAMSTVEGNLLTRLFTYNSEIITNKTDKGFIEFVNKFYLEIELYFKENQNLKFISYDINNDKVEKLKKYIDIQEHSHFSNNKM